MEDTHQDKPLEITIERLKEAKSPETMEETSTRVSASVTNKYHRWLLMGVFAILMLFSQTAATLLGRLYYEKGGNSKWLSAVLQVVGFPILLPFLYGTGTKKKRGNSDVEKRSPSAIVLGSIYIVLGILGAATGMLFSVGLLYLPVSTFTLVSASQLSFNALFSFFLNSQKLTPYVVNSLVLLTISSALLVFQTNSSGNTKSSKREYIVGFISTVMASALYSLILSLSQLAFNKILKRQTVREVLRFLFFQSLIACCILLIGLFASGEWKKLTGEMNEFELGKTSYAMTVVWIAICWQIFAIGLVGLTLKVSSLFANVISTLGLPILPILAAFIFKDKMSGVKVIAMLLAIWGFVSYLCQHYLDDLKTNGRNEDGSNVCEMSLI